MTYGRSILEDIRLAEEAGMVLPVAEVEVASEDEEGDGLEGLTVDRRSKQQGGWCLSGRCWQRTDGGGWRAGLKGLRGSERK
jgi:hypothetical protein